METSKLREQLSNIQKLLEEKEELEARLQKVSKEVEDLLKKLLPKPKPKRGLAHSLDYYLIRAMAPGAHMTPSEIAAKVVELGYPSSNKSLASYIQTYITKKRKDIVKVRHGVYMRRDNRNLVQIHQLNNKEFNYEKANC